MANAEFTRQQQNKQVGFEAGSYQKTEAAAPKRQLTPLQQKLEQLENALPAALRTQTAAAALCAVLVLGSVFGLGGAKLAAKYRQVAQSFTVGVAEDGGYSMWEELNTRANNAANIILTATNSGADAAYLAAAQQALAEFTAALEKGDVSELYAANQALTAAIDQLYADLQSKSDAPLQMGAVQTQYSQFNNAANVMNYLSYNQAALQYNQEAGGFPAGLIGWLWGVKEVELFA